MRRVFLGAALAVTLLPFVTAQAAPDFPAKPLKLMVGYAPGGPADSIGRAIAKELEAELKQPVAVENRAGAAGLIALDALTQSTPDGYTLGLLSNSSTTALHYAGKSLDLDKRAIPLGQFVATRLILVVNPKVVEVGNLKDLVELARRQPGLPYASSGHGSPGHLGMELFARQKGLKLTHVAYRGSAPAMQDLLAGRFGVKVVDASTAMPFITSGAIKPVVTVSTVRPPSLPDLPTAMEQGESAFQIDSTMALVVAPGTPAPVVERLQAALKRAAHSEGFEAHSRRVGNAMAWLDAADYKAWLQRDFDKWGKVIKEANITSEPK
jgi:tripartite-type tricarboxylate transporter receptor subunit TctC